MNIAEKFSLYDEFERCSHWLQAAMDQTGTTTHTMDDIVQGIENRSLQFWPADDAAMVTEIITYPQAMHIHVFLAGGNLDTIMAMRPDVERFGQSAGCSHLSMTGRAGWAKVLKDNGYKKTLHTVIKQLGG